MRFKFKKKLVLRPVTRKGRVVRCKKTRSLALKPYGAIATDREAELFGVFEDDAAKNKKRRRILNIKKKLRAAFAAIKRKIASRQKKPLLEPSLLLGAFCGVACVCALGASLVVYSLFGSYGGRYTDITIPDLIGLSKEEALSFGDGLFEYTVKYEFNPDAKVGSVISQSPSPSVKRKLYYGDNSLALSVTVNRPPYPVEMPATVGMPLREAELSLKNFGITVRVIREYSDLAPEGNVIYSSKPEGSPVDMGEQIILRVSKGREIPTVILPDLSGLTETAAVELLEKNDLRVGKIKYARSSLPQGRVIAQEYAAGSSHRQGSEISFTVSGGIGFSEGER